MKNKLLKYLLLLVLAIYPCVLLVTACKDKDEGEESYFVNLSESIDFSGGEGSESASLSDSTTVEESSEEESSFDSSTSSTVNSESLESSEDEDASESQDDFSEGGSIVGVEHYFVVTEVQPDCITEGFHEEKCGKCGIVTEYYKIPALGHTYKTVEGYAPTCQTTGRTEYTYCTRCNFVLDEAEEIPKAKHMITVGLGSCYWCDISVLRYKVAYREDSTQMRQYYAICVGAEIFTPYSVTRFVDIPDEVTLIETEGENKGKIYENIPVVEIAEKAFYQAYDVNKLTIGANVEKIGARAFDYCVNLREVYDKSKLRVGELDPTENGDITRNVKPEDIHYTKYDSKISIDDESGCIIYSDGDMKELIGIRDTKAHVIIPEGVTRISSCVFYKTRVIQELTIAKSVESIAWYAFMFDCERHEEEGHNNEKCKFQLKTIRFLNPEGWRAYEYEGQNYYPFHAEMLNETPTGAWRMLVMDYLKYHWVRKDNYDIPYV